MNTASQSKDTSIKHSILMLYKEILEFVKQDFHLLVYAYTFVFICVAIFFNYKFGFYAKVMNPTYFNGKSIPAFFLLYSTVYFAAAIPAFCLRGEYDLLKQPKFYLKSLLFIALYSLSVGFYSYRNWQVPSFSAEELAFVIKLVSNIKSVFFITIPLLIIKIFFDKKVKGLYGLSKNAKHLEVYLLALLVMLPFLAVTSFSGDFLNAYPQFRLWFYSNIFNMPAWLYTSIFETAYLGDFINTELFFRGAMVIGMTAILGKRAILPMVAFYVSIHFGKPLVETISSMFGGYILGILAYQTRHIWGGVMAHIGVAFTMEIMGFLRYYMDRE
ncbi:MAG: CPBP family intramembrane metalloprotease [Prevotellaceae bacterium]|nr:CPBP family intramembrane metalloprotease [Prevotellaceae bacterium]